MSPIPAKLAEFLNTEELAELLKEAASDLMQQVPSGGPKKPSFTEKLRGAANDVGSSFKGVAGKVRDAFGGGKKAPPAPSNVNVGQWWETQGGEYLKNNPGDISGFKKKMQADGIPEAQQKQFLRAAERIKGQQADSRFSGAPGGGGGARGFSLGDADPYIFSNRQQKGVNIGAGVLTGGMLLQSALAKKKENPNTEVPEWKGRLGHGIELGVPGAALGYLGGKALQGMGHVSHGGPLGALAGAAGGALAGQGMHSLHKVNDRWNAERASEGDEELAKNIKGRASLTESSHRGLSLLAKTPNAAYTAMSLHGNPGVRDMIPTGVPFITAALGSVGGGMANKYHAANTYKQMRGLEKEGAGAPTRGGFMQASDMPPFRAPRLDRAIQKEGDMMGDYVSYNPGDFKQTNILKKHAYTLGDATVVLPSIAAAGGAAAGYHKGKESDRGTSGALRGAAGAALGTVAGGLGGMTAGHMMTGSSGYGGGLGLLGGAALGGYSGYKALTHGLEDKHAAATTPAGILAHAKGVGAPKVTAPSTPSTAEQVKPKGFGMPMAGATK